MFEWKSTVWGHLGHRSELIKRVLVFELYLSTLHNLLLSVPFLGDIFSYLGTLSKPLRQCRCLVDVKLNSLVLLIAPEKQERKYILKWEKKKVRAYILDIHKILVASPHITYIFQSILWTSLYCHVIVHILVLFYVKFIVKCTYHVNVFYCKKIYKKD